MVKLQNDLQSLLSWTFFKFQTIQNLNSFFFSLVLEDSTLCEVLGVGNSHFHVPVEANESIFFHFSGSQSIGRSLCSVWNSPTRTQNQEQVRQRHRILRVHLGQSSGKHCRQRSSLQKVAWCPVFGPIPVLTIPVPSPCQVLQPAVQESSNRFFFLFIFCFVLFCFKRARSNSFWFATKSLYWYAMYQDQMGYICLEKQQEEVLQQNQSINNINPIS